MHGYVDWDGYVQLEFLSKTDQGVQGEHVGAEVPFVEKNISARLKAGRLLLVVGAHH